MHPKHGHVQFIGLRSRPECRDSLLQPAELDYTLAGLPDMALLLQHQAAARTDALHDAREQQGDTLSTAQPGRHAHDSRGQTAELTSTRSPDSRMRWAVSLAQAPNWSVTHSSRTCRPATRSGHIKNTRCNPSSMWLPYVPFSWSYPLRLSCSAHPSWAGVRWSHHRPGRGCEWGSTAYAGGSACQQLKGKLWAQAGRQAL